MSAHMQRVVSEKADLDVKVAALTAFFESDTFKGLDITSQSLLLNQAYYMSSYSSILGTRIYLSNAAISSE